MPPSIGPCTAGFGTAAACAAAGAPPTRIAPEETSAHDTAQSLPLTIASPSLMPSGCPAAAEWLPCRAAGYVRLAGLVKESVLTHRRFHPRRRTGRSGAREAHGRLGGAPAPAGCRADRLGAAWK